MAAAIRTNREEREFQSYVRALLSTGTNRDVLKALLELEVPRPYRVRAKVVYSPASPINVFRHLQEKERIKALSDSADSFVRSEVVGRIAPTKVSVPFFVASFEEDDAISQRVQVVISVCKSDQWKVLQRFIRSNYPKLGPILLSQGELVTGAKNLLRQSGHEVRVKTFSAVKEALAGSEGKSRKSVREWTDEQLDEALRGIKERGQALTSSGIRSRGSESTHMWCHGLPARSGRREKSKSPGVCVLRSTPLPKRSPEWERGRCFISQAAVFAR